LLELFIFDIAGTTVRDDGFVTRAFFAAAETIGARPTAEWTRARMGLDKREVFREMLESAGRPAADAELLAEAFEASIEREIAANAPIRLPGAAEAIELLTARGVKVAFTTGFSARTGEAVLRRVGWGDRVLVASDQVAHGRPAPDLNREAMRRSGVLDPSRVGVAGDTPSDLLAGRATGCRFVVGVGNGTHTLDELARVEPHTYTHLIPDLTSLPEVLRGAM
jgi:phosphonatase-like hydrolase